MVHDLCRNVDVISLTRGEQKRDFIHVLDVASAVLSIIENRAALSCGFNAFEVGTGHSTSIKEVVSLIQSLAKSSTRLEFGALDYRENEIMESFADLRALSRIGWQPSVDLFSGIEGLVKGTLKKLGVP